MPPELAPPVTDEHIAAFRNDVRSLDPVRVIRKHVIAGPCAIYKRHDDYYDLVESIADKFHVHPSSVMVVGSAKLGFSIAPEKRYRRFCDTSDIDVAIVSEELFSRFWEEFHFAKIRDVDWRRKDRFLKNLFRGWIRPDLFPEVETRTSSNWWEFFQRLSKRHPTKVTAGVYRSWHFLEDYQRAGIEGCLQQEWETA